MPPTDVAAAVTYHPGRDQYLILQRAETLDVFPGRWDFPSGKMEDGENAEDAALRELREETGFDGDVQRDGGRFTVDTRHGTFRIHPVLVAVDRAEPALSSEHTAYRWIDADALDDYDTVPALEQDLVEVGVLDR